MLNVLKTVRRRQERVREDNVTPKTNGQSNAELLVLKMRE
jgi:hypothetical protein